MEIKIFYALISLLIISTGTVFAAELEIDVKTNASNYNEGDIVIVSGNVSIVFTDNLPITLQIFLEGSDPDDLSLVDIAQITVAQDGSYSHTIIAEGPLWKNSGKYIITVTYGEGNSVETEFSYTPKSASIETTTMFDIDVKGYGTFDIEYTIKGGTVIDMIADPEFVTIIVIINSTDSGTISLDLPRELIDANTQDGVDDRFIILIDGMEIVHQESLIDEDFRRITINFEDGDSDIALIGTYLVPEFGTIAMMIMIAGIITVILASRNKFQIKV